MRHTQIGWVFIIIIIPLVLFMTFYQPDLQNLHLMWSIAFIILLLFFKLTISVDDKYVKFSFGIGIIRGKFLLADIESCTAKSYVSLGWGIRYRPGIVIYNVSGNKAIELIVRSKRNKIWLGTNKPEEFVKFINQRIDSLSK